MYQTLFAELHTLQCSLIVTNLYLILENPVAVQLMTFPAFNGTIGFITVFTRTRH
jgi:hypothetical protein